MSENLSPRNPNRLVPPVLTGALLGLVLLTACYQPSTPPAATPTVLRPTHTATPTVVLSTDWRVCGQAAPTDETAMGVLRRASGQEPGPMSPGFVEAVIEILRWGPDGVTVEVFPFEEGADQPVKKGDDVCHTVKPRLVATATAVAKGQ